MERYFTVHELNTTQHKSPFNLLWAMTNRRKDFVWDALFFPEKVDDFLVVAFKAHVKTA